MATPWISGLLALRLSAELSEHGDFLTKDFEQTLFQKPGVIDDLGQTGRDVSYGRGVPAPDKFTEVKPADTPIGDGGDNFCLVLHNVSREDLEGFKNGVKFY